MDLLSFFLAVAFMIVTIGGIIVAGVIVIKSNNSNFINRDEANSKQKAQIIAKMKQGNFCKYESNVAKLHFFICRSRRASGAVRGLSQCAQGGLLHAAARAALLPLQRF